MQAIEEERSKLTHVQKKAAEQIARSQKLGQSKGVESRKQMRELSQQIHALEATIQDMETGHQSAVVALKQQLASAVHKLKQQETR